MNLEEEFIILADLAREIQLVSHVLAPDYHKSYTCHLMTFRSIP